MYTCVHMCVFEWACIIACFFYSKMGVWHKYKYVQKHVMLFVTHRQSGCSCFKHMIWYHLDKTISCGPSFQVFPGPVQADRPDVRHSQGFSCVRVFPNQRHKPTGAGQHIRWSVEDRQQKQRSGEFRLWPIRGDPEGESLSRLSRCEQVFRLHNHDKSRCLCECMNFFFSFFLSLNACCV